MAEKTEQRTEEIKAYQPYTGPERRMSHSTQNQIIKRKQARIGFALGIVALAINGFLFISMPLGLITGTTMLSIAIVPLIISFPCGIIGLVMSVRGLKCKRYGMALAGIIINAATILLTIIVTIILITAINNIAPYLKDQFDGVQWKN